MPLLGMAFFYQPAGVIKLVVVARHNRQDTKNFRQVMLGDLGFMPGENAWREGFGFAGKRTSAVPNFATH